jgi:hypothetical protein
MNTPSDKAIRRASDDANPEIRRRRSRGWLAPQLSRIAAGVGLVLAEIASAQPTQEEFFRSMHENVNRSGGGGRTLPVLLALIALGIVMLLIYNRRERKESPRILHHHRRLVSEMRARTGIPRSRLKPLTPVARRIGCSPLTLLMCPSLQQDRPASSENSSAIQ